MDLSEVIIWFEQHPDKILNDIKINPWTTVADGKLFVESHLSILCKYGGRPLYRPYWKRLYAYWQLCQGNLVEPYKKVKLLREYRKKYGEQ